MITGNEKIAKYLGGISPPDYTSAEHRSRLRQEILAGLDRQDSGGNRGKAWKFAVIVAGLLCVGALAGEVALQVHRYYFEGRAGDGSYRFATPPQLIYKADTSNGATLGPTVVQTTVTSVSMDEIGSGGVEQMRRDLEEIDSLRQRGERELLGVTDTTVNGHPMPRVCQFSYRLSDGRVHTMNEGFASAGGTTSPAQREKDQAEIAELRKEGRKEILKVIETHLEGQIQRTLLCQYVLSDGREETVGEGDPASTPATRALTDEQQTELRRLMGLKQGEFLGTEEREMYGRTFSFEKYSYQLADGTIVVHLEGEPKGRKRTLTGSDWKELASLRQSAAGEVLGEYQEELMGKSFWFEQRRYVLSDGTEVIHSRGVPADGK